MYSLAVCDRFDVMIGRLRIFRNSMASQAGLVLRDGPDVLQTFIIRLRQLETEFCNSYQVVHIRHSLDLADGSVKLFPVQMRWYFLEQHGQA